MPTVHSLDEVDEFLNTLSSIQEKNRRNTTVTNLLSFKNVVAILCNPERKFSRVQSKTIEEGKDNPLEGAVIQKSVVILSDKDLANLKGLSLDDIPSSWGGLNVNKCDESPARVRSVVKIQFPLIVDGCIRVIGPNV